MQILLSNYENFILKKNQKFVYWRFVTEAVIFSESRNGFVR